MADKTSTARVNVFINSDASQKQLERLSAQSVKLSEKLAKAKEGTAEYVKTSEQLAKVNSHMQHISDVIDGKVQPSLKMMTDQAQRLNNELKSLPVNSQEYFAKMAQLNVVNREIDGHMAKVKGTAGAWSKVIGLAKDYGITALGIVGVQYVFGSINNLLKKNAELSDSMASIQKTTGMTKAEVEELNKSFSDFSTRSTRDELLKIAQIGGQFGIAKDQIKDFVRSVDMANVALGDEFSGGAEEVTKQLGGLQKLFGQTANLEAGDAINKIGSAINELGAAGAATGPEVAEFTRRIGALGSMAPAITQTMGLGAALQELGLTAEISASGLTKVITETNSRTNSFSAEMQKLQNTNPNEFLLRLAESFKGLSNTQLSAKMTELGINSQEAIKVMSLLANKTDFVREKQELASKAFAEGTSLSREFNVMNSTLGANLEKIGKAINGLFVNSTLTKVLQALASGIASAIEPAEDLSRGLREQAQNAMQSRLEFEYMTEALKDGNLSNEQRSMLIKQINSQYKEFLPNQITEATTLKELNAIQIETVKILEKRYRVKAAEASLQELASKQLKNELEIEKLNNEVIKKRIELQAPKQTQSVSTGDELRNYREVRSVADQNKDIQIEINALNEGIKRLKAANESYKAEFNKITATAMELGSKGLTSSAAGPSMAAVIGVGTEASSKAYQSELDALKSFTDSVDDLLFKANQIQREQEDREMAEVRLKYDQQIRKAEESQDKVSRNLELSASQRKSIIARYESEILDLQAGKADELARTESMQMQRRMDARNQAIEQERKYLQRIEGLIATGRSNAITKEDGELAAIRAKYDQELLMLDQHQQEVIMSKQLSEEDKINLDRQYSQKRIELLLAAEDELARKKKELEIKRNETKRNEVGQVGDFINPDSNAGEIAALENMYDRMLEIARKYNLDETALADAKARQMALINERVVKDTTNREFAVMNARIGVYKELANVAAQVGNLMVSTGGAATEYMKGVALAQIAINTAISIASAIKGATEAAAATGPAAPFTLAGYIIGMVGTVVGAFAQASTVLSTAQTEAPPRFSVGSFYSGGFTGSGSGVYDNQGREVAGLVHAREYVIPEKVLKDPAVFNMTRSIEAIRQGKQVATNASDPRIDQLIANQTAMIAKMDNWQSSINVKLDLDSLNRAQDELSAVRNNGIFVKPTSQQLK